MAKKGQAVQLQTEVGTDEEWEKLLQKNGLIVVDVYSDWCGPCQGMAANLKKLKLEIGGDMLQLAMAKCDNITDLERFRYKSEPTWMLISKGKMVDLMFGADAPKLTRLIIEELKNEQLVASGEKIRENLLDINQMTEIEQTRNEAAESITRKAKEKEKAKRAKQIHDWKVEECHNILNNLHGFGVVLIFPNARDKYWEVMSDMINEAGLIVQQTEKVNMTKENLDELLYFNHNEDEEGNEEEEFDEQSSEDLLNNQCKIICLKPQHGVEIADIDDTILTIVYGAQKKPPGTEDSAFQKLLCVITDENTKEEQKLLGIWAPRYPFVKATCFKLFFHKLANQYELAAPEPEPEHVAIVFDTHQISDAMHIMSEYPNEIMHYGFFTKEDPEDTELVAKSLRKLELPENKSKRTFTEKLVIQLTKRKSECVFAFAQLEPLSMSPNSEEGARECQIFFPDDYAESLDEEDIHIQLDVIEEFEEEITKPEAQEPVPEETQEVVDSVSEKGDDTTEEKAEEEDDMDMFNMDPVKLNKDTVDNMLFFCETKLSTKTIDDFSQNRISLALLMKRSSENLSGDIDDVVLQMVYGNTRKPPGDEKSLSQKLISKPGDDEEENILIGIWAPPNNLSKASALKYLFPNLTASYRFPEMEISPFYVAVSYDAFKAPEVMELSEKFPGQVMAMGFFTSDKPPEAHLIVKTVKEFEERTIAPTYDEKIVIQLAKTNNDCVTAFLELGPSYISTDVEAGEVDCKYFFPRDYNVSEEEIVQVKKKPKKKGRSKPYTQEETASTAASDLIKDQSDLDHDELEEVDSEDEKIVEDTLEYNEVTGADKATSPIGDKIEE